MEKDFYVYMLATKKCGTLYKGITSNLPKRIWEHKNGIGSQFTKEYGVKNLVWFEHCGTWDNAVRWEKRLRRYKRQWKINLIEEHNPNWNDLSHTLFNQPMDCTHKACNDEGWVDDGIKLREISKKLNSPLEARMLIKHITGLSDADLIGMDSISLTDTQKEWLDNAIKQRLNSRPISKIIGYKEFYGRRFFVNDDVLDPRPETELIIDETIRHCERSEAIQEHHIQPLACRVANAPRNDDVRILDLGTGSGCILLTLLSEIPHSIGIGTDISIKALNIAEQNAESLAVCDRVKFIESNWFDSVTGQFDIIVTNPPYIETHTLVSLDEDVKNYDPVQALDGGEDGLEPYKVILPQIRKHLKPNGFFMCEHGTGQSQDIKRLAKNAGLSEIRVHHDLAGHDRCVSALVPKN
jgi:release factor glutamine methyltransferase